MQATLPHDTATRPQHKTHGTQSERLGSGAKHFSFFTIVSLFYFVLILLPSAEGRESVCTVQCYATRMYRPGQVYTWHHRDALVHILCLRYISSHVTPTRAIITRLT